MKKLYSLIKASMTSGMNVFKIRSKKEGKKNSSLLPTLIGLYLMFMLWGMANSMYEKVDPLNIEYILLALFAFSISIITIIEGIYKAGPLIFNCKDDQLLLSLPIERSTVLFIRIFKFYVFELIFNTIFLLPTMIAYIRWGENITWTYYLTSIIMLFLLPIIPIIISCIIAAIISSISSRFRFKNAAQIIISTLFLIGMLFVSYNLEDMFNYIAKHATSINDFITKIYYPAGVYSKLVTDFNAVDLIKFILINLAIFGLFIFVLSKFYFKINSRLKNVSTNKSTKIEKVKIATKTPTQSLIKKEFNIFFKTPVFIINAGFALVLFILLAVMICIRYGSMITLLTNPETGFNLPMEFVTNNKSLLIFTLIALTSFMTSITSSVISLEGRKINILKSLPVSTKEILMAKIYSSLLLTTPAMIIGDIILFIKFKTNILEILLLLAASIILPLASHLIGLIVNLKYPKLDAETSAEVVKQSVSSFVSVMIGMILVVTFVIVLVKLIKKVSAILLLVSFTGVFLLIDILLYIYLINKGVKDFNNLTV